MAEPQKVSLSPTNPEPLASMKVWALTVELGGSTFVVPPYDAASWLEILLAESIDVEKILPGFCGHAAVAEVNRMLLDDVITEQDLEQAFFDLLEEASGRRWWITLRLCRVLRINWETVGGQLAANGVTPFGVSLSHWLDGAYTMLIKALVESNSDNLRQVASFTHTLTTPPPSVTRDEFDETEAGNAFLAAMRIAR